MSDTWNIDINYITPADIGSYSDEIGTEQAKVNNDFIACMAN